MLPNVAGLGGPFGCLNNARYGIAWGPWVPPNSAEAGAQLHDGLASSSAALRGQPALQRSSADMQTEFALGLQAAFASAASDEGKAQPEMISRRSHRCGEGARYRHARARYAAATAYRTST